MRMISYVLLRVVAFVLMAGLLAWFAERRLDRAAEAKSFSTVANVPPADVALVLGTSPIGPEGGPNRFFVFRLDAAAELYKAGKAKYFIVSGAVDSRYDEPLAMRDGLVARGVPADAIYRDPSGDRTVDSIVRARQIYGQTRLIIVSQRFHLARALFLALHEGIDAWGFEAQDVRAFSIFTELRRYPSALRAYWEVWTGLPPATGKSVAIGVDPPS
jgi:SanA protein